MLVFLASALLIHFVIAEADPITTTSYGKLRGFDYKRSDGGFSEVFLGIPFAKPPIGTLRFEKPKPPESWEDVLDATKYGPACYPHNKTEIREPTSEDCLHLGVIRPKEAKTSEKLPVLVWIHPGGYSVSSASNYHYSGLANIYNPHGIIVVVIQYRLGFFGFFSDGNDLPGNLGLWDQVQALQFIQETIEDFGGDKNKATIWGMSAGGASASQLALSPHAEDLFHRQIAMSGGALMNWAFGENVILHSEAMVFELGCSLNVPLKECLQELPVERFYDAVEVLGSSQYSMDLLKWHPRVDGDLFPAEPEILITKALKRPQLMGVAKKESLFFVILNEGKSMQTLEVDPSEFQNFDRDELEKRIKLRFQDLIAISEYFGQKHENVFEEIMREYTSGEQDNNRSGFYLEMYAKLLSDLNFNVGMIREAKLRAQNGLPTFVYLTEHFNKAIYPEGYEVTGATHVSELPYIFEIFPSGKFAINGDTVEESVNKIFQQTMINFVKTGLPTNDISPWEALTSETLDDLPYLRISATPTMEKGLFARELEFWDRISRDYGYDLVSLEKKPKIRGEKFEL